MIKILFVCHGSISKSPPRSLIYQWFCGSKGCLLHHDYTILKEPCCDNPNMADLRKAAIFSRAEYSRWLQQTKRCRSSLEKGCPGIFSHILRLIVLTPCPHGIENGFQTFPQVCQAVFHPRRNFGIYFAVH